LKKKTGSEINYIIALGLFIFSMLFIAILFNTSDHGTSTTGFKEEKADVSSKEKIVQKEATKIKYIDFYASAKNWDGDAEADGLEVTIYPKDDRDIFIKVGGKIEATLYKREFDSHYNVKRGSWILRWTKYIAIDNCGFFGCTIRLEREDLEEIDDKFYLDNIAILEVTLTTQDGKSFTATEDFVYLKP